MFVIGLDNGIILVKKNREKEVNFPSDFTWRGDWKEYDDFHFPTQEVCYWRKCWNIRDAICDILGDRYDGNGGDVILSFNDLKEIWKALNKMNSKKNWDSTQSIWRYDEIQDTLDHDLLNLEYLISLGENSDFDYIFYDSY